MARKKVVVRQPWHRSERSPVTGQQDLPVSGERVMMPSERSPFNRMPKVSEKHAVEIANAGAARATWEQSNVGKKRLTSGIPPGISVGQFHNINNADIEPDVGHRHYDVQLPGMADPNAAPRPPKYEELNDAHRAHIDMHLSRFGTNVDQMISDIGTQIDQAHVRAHAHGHDKPFGSDFYENGEPRKVIDKSAKELGIPQPVHAMVNAFTSPNTKFAQHVATGPTRYPNNEAAVHVVKWAQDRRNDPEKITNKRITTDPTADPEAGHQGYETNMRKAAKAVRQHMEGVAPADWRLGVKDESPFEGSPKAGPYANAWSDTHPQFNVADVHTGGGGAFPHLSSDKPVKADEHGTPILSSKGKETRLKSERELAIEKVPFSHSVIDYAMRQAMEQRGMGSVRRSQGTQWGEEAIQRREAGSYRTGPTAAMAYPPKAAKTNAQHAAEVADRMFNDRSLPRGRARLATVKQRSRGNPASTGSSTGVQESLF